MGRLRPCVFTLTPFFNLILTLLGQTESGIYGIYGLSNFMILQQPRERQLLWGRGEELKCSQPQQN